MVEIIRARTQVWKSDGTMIVLSDIRYKNLDGINTQECEADEQMG